MLFKSVKGMFQVKTNYREAFDLEMFESKYIEECMDKYAYIVGDISSNILRLKGFDLNPNSPAYFKNITSYLETSCSFGCPHYVLKRIRTEEEYESIARKEASEAPVVEKPLITPMAKENFDKESLVLNTTPKQKPNIVLDINKINAIPKGDLAPDLVEAIKQDKASISRTPAKAEPEVKKEETTYVSASPDFDPSKSNSFKFNKNNKNNNNNNNKNNRPNNNNKPNNANKQNNKPNNNQNGNNVNQQNNGNKQHNANTPNNNNNKNNRPNNRPNNHNNKNRNNVVKKGNNNG